MKRLHLILSQPLSHAGQALLQQALQQAGISHHDYDITQASEGSKASCGSRRYNCTVTLGDGAASACMAGWQRGWIQDRRGYVWEGDESGKLLTTLDPEDCLIRRDPSGINGMLLVADLEAAKREARDASLFRVHRNTQVIASAREAADAARRIKVASYVACDIECSDASTLLCIGFATSPTQAYVFAGAALDAGLALLADPSVGKVFQNGQFDAYFVATRCGVRIENWQDDCMIAWHALWPEIAGKGNKASKQTRKSLAFLASLYTASPEYWKYYDGASEADMYQLNGLDCCITLEIMQNLRKEIEEQGVQAIYRHEMSMMPVLVAIQERGLLVDEDARVAAFSELQARAASITERIRSAGEPLLRASRDKLAKPHLFFGTRRCSCCNGGKGKRMACWSCAGLAKAPGKKAAALLEPCKVCGGVGSCDTFDFNPASTQQLVELFYGALGLPKRYNDGKLTVDEKALKGLLADVGV